MTTSASGSPKRSSPRQRKAYPVRVLYDWMGGLTETGHAYWRRMRDGGVDVRCFNPPRFDSPLGWLSRLHRKSLCVDGSVAYVSGLCVGRMWTGYPEKNIPPWRDTGVEIRGPVVADIVQSFSRAWAETGPELPANETTDAGCPPGSRRSRYKGTGGQRRNRRTIPAGTVDCGAGAKNAVAHRCILRRHHQLRTSVARRGHGWCGRAAAGPGFERGSQIFAARFARRLPAVA